MYSVPSPAHAWRWGNWRLRLQVDFSSGYDDNVRRIALPPEPENLYSWGATSFLKKQILSPLPPVSIHGDGMHQISLQTRLAFRSGHHLWYLKYQAGYKHFFLTMDEDALSQKASSTYYFRLHRRVLLGFQASASDLRRRNQSRESSGVNGRLILLWFAPFGVKVNIQGGYGAFQYRHLENFSEAHLENFSDGERYSNHGDSYRLSLRKRFSRVFRAWTSYQFSRQFFQVLRTRSGMSACAASIRSSRTDSQHRASVGFRVLFYVLFDTSYQFEANDSESCGGSYIGHRIFFRFGARPFWKLYLSAELQLQFRSFLDGAPLNPSFPSNQQDSLTTFSLRLSRPILPHLRVNLRYSHFSNLFGLGINQYERNLFMVGMSIRF